MTAEPPQEVAGRRLDHPASEAVSPVESRTESRRDRVLRRLEAIAVSVFIGFHVTTLLVYSTPADGLGARVRSLFNRYLEMDAYMSVTGNATRWEMFAPDPARQNPFVRVLVEDARGRVQDVEHDIHGRRTYPYLFFDRLAKINAWSLRRKDNREGYAAWVCRDWERRHGGEAASVVRLVRFMTEIPPPEVAYATGGYNAALLDVQLLSEEAFACRTLPHGQLPPSLRTRFGFAPAAPGTFRDVEVSTWRQRPLRETALQ